MPKRIALEDDKPSGGGRYFENPTDVRCFSSGATLLDCVLSGPRKNGGWALGRISNVVGDRATAKTGTLVEATANFALEFANPKKHKIRYREVESAMDKGYAVSQGLNLDRVELPDDGAVDTVEDLFKDLEQFIDSVPVDGAGLYGLDSLDALSDNSELKEEFGKGSYGTGKAKLLGQLFRRLVRKIENRQIHVMIISQLRDKLSIGFGEKQSRSGGRALDYYASQVVWLAKLGTITATKGGVKRPIGVDVRVKCKKNKVAMPFRECDIPIMFAYGMDDFSSGINWLESVKMLDRLGLTQASVKKYLSDFAKMSGRDANIARAKVSEAVRQAWLEVEKRFLPKRSKYG